MDAQEKWKQYYRTAINYWHEHRFEKAYVYMLEARKHTREAALERVIARQQREIEALKAERDQLNAEIGTLMAPDEVQEQFDWQSTMLNR